MAKPEKKMLPEEDYAVIKEYGHLLNNTGGNDPVDLVMDLINDRNLATTNIVRFTLAACIQSQIVLIKDLKKEGLL